jgi:RNA polymerase sigma factor (sigma-70 family)
MRTGPINRVIDHLRTVRLPDGAGLDDGQLLGGFVERRDETALAALVGRHGPMVWGVCRRLLNHHDAADAFQATFLVLVRKAASIRSREMVGNWLYGVARQTALVARRTAARRRAREVPVTEMPDREAAQHDPWPDLRSLIDEELSRLPKNYRAAIVLCGLEGRSRKEVAGQLGVPEGTVAGRLARARAMLAKRLAKRGVVFPGGALAAVLSAGSVPASASPAPVASAVEAAGRLPAGRAAEGVISAKVTALTEGVLKAMLLRQLQAATALVLVALAGVLVSGLLLRVQAADPPKGSEVRPASGQVGKTDREMPSRAGREVVSAFERNRARVDQDYLNRKMRVSGKMFRVERMGGYFGIKESDDQYYYLTLAADPKEGREREGPGPAETELPLAFVFPVSARKPLAALERGQPLTIEGTCEGKKGPAGQYMGHYVVFTSCQVVNE